MHGVRKRTTLNMSTKCKTNQTHQHGQGKGGHGQGTHARRGRVHAHVPQETVRVDSMQDKQARQRTRKQGQGTCTRMQGMRTHKVHSLQALGQWRQAFHFCYRCRLSWLPRLLRIRIIGSCWACRRVRKVVHVRSVAADASCRATYVVWLIAHSHLGLPSSPGHVIPGPRALQLTQSVSSGPHLRTGACSETCFHRAMRVGKAIAHMQSAPLAAPSARRAPVSRDIANLVNVVFGFLFVMPLQC